MSGRKTQNIIVGTVVLVALFLLIFGMAFLNEYPNIEIEMSAHTDSKGSDEYNMTLSDNRAKSVREYILSKGIAAKRITSQGYGETKPVAPNANDDGTDNPEGRQLNRRVEFKILKN